LLGAFAKKLQKETDDSFAMSVLSACENSAPTERISTKFDI